MTVRCNSGQPRARHVRLLVTLVTLGAVGTSVASLRSAPSASLGPFVLVVAVGAVLAFAQLCPTFVSWGSEAEDTTLEEAVLAVGLVLLPTTGVLVASIASTVCTQLWQRRAPLKITFNLATHAGGIALGGMVIHASVGSVSGPLTSAQVLAVAGAVTAFTVTQALLVWLVLATASGSAYWGILRLAAPPAALSFAVTASWGLLMAVAVRHLDWTIALGLAPFVLLRALHRAEGDRSRLRGLLHTASTTAAASAESRDAVQASVELAARSLLISDRAELRSTPPGEGELGACLMTAPAARWLITGGRNDAHPYASEDQELLDGIAAIASVALDNAEMVDHLAHAALHDPLTALPNRLFFTSEVTSAITRCQTENDSTFGVLSIDIDRFKRINDSLGHLAGDELLRQIACRLKAAVRSSDVVCRLGGDELAVVVGKGSRSEDLARSAQRILRSLTGPFDIGGSQVFITASIGIAHFPTHGDTPEFLLRSADRALYRAKTAGRNGFRIHDADDGGPEDLALEHDLHLAISRDELWVAYQPVISADGNARSVEALVRWDHPQLGSVPPDRFLRIAEEVGLITLIDLWVLDRAVYQLARWREAGLSHVRMAVNVSARTLSQTGFEERVAETLRRQMVPAANLELEITEQVAVQEPLAVVERLRRLRDTGVTIAIDDFGTGHSSLSRLNAFPADRLKIDRAFVGKLVKDQLNPIVAATIAMGHHLGLEVVAEGVETAEQLEVLRTLGCDASQGWLFAPALVAEEAAVELRRRLPPLCVETRYLHLAH